jgi:hypothetical protein
MQLKRLHLIIYKLIREILYLKWWKLIENVKMLDYWSFIGITPSILWSWRLIAFQFKSLSIIIWKKYRSKYKITLWNEYKFKSIRIARIDRIL